MKRAVRTLATGRWFASEGASAKLKREDAAIRAALMERLRQAAVSKLVIERLGRACRVTVHVARPGVAVGRDRAKIEALRGLVGSMTAADVTIRVVDVPQPETQAALVADAIAWRLERGVTVRRAMTRAVRSAMRLGAEGIRINCYGRLGGGGNARQQWHREGRVPLHTLRADIDYGTSAASTPDGALGIKVWVFKGLAEAAPADDALDVRAADVAEALIRRNPRASLARIEEVSDLIAAFGAAIRRSDPRGAGPAGAPDAAPEAGPRGDVSSRRSPVPRGPLEIGRGVPLGRRIDPEAGARRLAAAAAPLPLEAWAGPVAGPNEIAAQLRIPRSTLQDWRRGGAAIGLLRGTRKHVFPLAQFVDGRPVPGLAEVVAIVGDPRTAWLWLVEPRRRGGSPLADLKAGRVEAVREAAREDFA